MSKELPDLNVGIKDKVSIIIPAYRQLPYVKKCVESIVKYTTYPDYELLISDDASGMPELLNYFKDLILEKKIKTLVLSSENKPARNLMKGVFSSDGQFTCLINDDCEIPEDQGDWLTVLVNNLKAMRGKWASVTPAMYHSSKSKTVYWVGKIKENTNKPFHDFLHTPFGDPKLPTNPVQCTYNTFACVVMWLGLIYALPFGKHHQRYGGDSDWCWEMASEFGLEHWCIPSTHVYHENIYMLRG